MPRLLAVAKALACAPAHNPSLLQAARALLAAVQCRTFASSTAAWRSAEQGLPAAAAAASPRPSEALSSVPVEQLQRAITPEVGPHRAHIDCNNSWLWVARAATAHSAAHVACDAACSLLAFTRQACNPLCSAAACRAFALMVAPPCPCPQLESGVPAPAAPRLCGRRQRAGRPRCRGAARRGRGAAPANAQELHPPGAARRHGAARKGARFRGGAPAAADAGKRADGPSESLQVWLPPGQAVSTKRQAAGPAAGAGRRALEAAL